jgi:hypothetical protein
MLFSTDRTIVVDSAGGPHRNAADDERETIYRCALLSLYE